MSLRLQMVVAASLVVGGCGWLGGSFGEVTGRVMLDGKPVEGLVLRFQPPVPADATAATPPPPAYGRTDADGRYRVFRTGRNLFGTVVGMNAVSITPPEGGTIVLPAEVAGGGLSCDVKPGSNTFDLDLKSDSAPAKK